MTKKQHNRMRHSSSGSRITELIVLAVLFALPAQAQIRLNLGEKSPMHKLQIAEMAINNLYVDTINESTLVEDAIRGMLDKLDPHSSYTTAKETKAISEPLQGSFDGIGVQFNMSDDTLLVIQTITGGPSEKVGIMAGDRIVTVNDTSIAGVKMSTDDVMRRLRGKRGTKVRLGVTRRGIADTLRFVVTRDKIPLNTVDAAYMIQPGMGYIRLGSFGATTHKEFMQRVDSLRLQGMTKLIIDLQENGGGYLQSAVNVAGEFLEKGDLIVYTEGRAASREEFKARGGGSLTDCEVAVLVNEYSASAAEILAGAMQDHDRAVVVGRRSFGKGLVQRPIEFSDGSMIRLTVAHYYTPSGRCIQKPYEKGAQKDYAKDIENRLMHGEMFSADSIQFADSLRCYTLRRHRTVYGGGGIMPDVFVPLDTAQYTAFHRQAMARGVIVKTTLRYVDDNRTALKSSYPSFDAFNTGYEVPQTLADEVIAEAESLGVKPSDADEYERTMPQLCLQLKALIARDIWGVDEYFQVMNERNHIVQKAVEMLTTGMSFPDDYSSDDVDAADTVD